jgi:hypothetical protein
MSPSRGTPRTAEGDDVPDDGDLGLSAEQLHLVSCFDGCSAVEVAQVLGCSLPELAEQLVAIRTVLGVDSTAAAVAAVRAHRR